MVGVLIRMKLAILQHSPSGRRRLGLIGGLVLAAATVTIAVRGLVGTDRSAAVEMMGLALALWTSGWVLAPVLFASDRSIRPEHLALLPVPPRQLAAGLAGSAFVGVGPLVTAVAFTGMIVLAADQGAAALVAGMVGTIWLLVLAVVASRVMAAGLKASTRSRLGMELAGVFWGMAIAGMFVIWFTLDALVAEVGALVSDGLPSVVATVVSVLPSGWGLVVMEAAAAGEWLRVAVMLAVMGVALGLVFWGWIGLLGRPGHRATVRVRARRSRVTVLGRGAWSAGWLAVLSATPVGAATAKELRTWWQDPWRALELRASLWSGVFLGLIPVIAGWTTLVPFIGVMTVFVAGAAGANLYGLDGTALWQVLVTPGGERVDVRGRQVAWLLAFGPLAVALSAIAIGVTGEHWAWPWVLSGLAGMLGGGAGVIAAVSVVGMAPVMEPNRRTSPFDSNAENEIAVYVAFLLMLAAAVPPGLVVLAGALIESALLSWLGVPVGVVTGGLLAVWLGGFAHRRLSARGPEMLLRMRTG